MASCLKQIDPAVLEPIVDGRWLEGYDVSDVARGLTCPTLVMQADSAAGGMLTDADAALLRSNISDLVWASFPGVGHLIHGSDPLGTLRVLQSFLESLR